MKHYILVEFLSNLNVQPPARTQSPPIDAFSGDGSDYGPV